MLCGNDHVCSIGTGTGALWERPCVLCENAHLPRTSSVFPSVALFVKVAARSSSGVPAGFTVGMRDSVLASPAPLSDNTAHRNEFA